MEKSLENEYISSLEAKFKNSCVKKTELSDLFGIRVIISNLDIHFFLIYFIFENLLYTKLMSDAVSPMIERRSFMQLKFFEVSIKA